MNVVVLVPWRPGEPFRDKNWEITRPHLEALGYPLFLGDCPGDWSRAQACNQAARHARDWDVAIIADADTILEPKAVKAAIRKVGKTNGAARPHDKRWMLTLYAVKLVAMKGLAGLRPRDLTNTAPGGGALVITRDAWEAVRGYDETFVGWGYEDSEMNLRLVAERSWDIVPGNAYHLYHPIPNPGSISAKTNRRRLDVARERYAEIVESRSAEVGFDLNTVL